MADVIPVQPIGLQQTAPVDATQLRVAKPAGTAPAKSFQTTLTETITEVQRLRNEADTTIKKLVAGEIKDVSEAMVAVERADISFQTMMLVRNKIVTAYEEVMRMQV